MLILFQPACFSSSGSDHFNIREINSQFFATVFASSVPRCLCFPALFLQGLRFLNQVSFFIDGKSLHSFPSMFLSGDSQEDTNGASSSSFSFLLRWIQFKFSGLITFFSLFQMLSHVGASLNHPPLAIHVIWSAEDISEDSHFHSQSVQAISRLLSLLSHLIQPAQSFF